MTNIRILVRVGLLVLLAVVILRSKYTGTQSIDSAEVLKNDSSVSQDSTSSLVSPNLEIQDSSLNDCDSVDETELVNLSESLSVISDNTLAIHRREMPAYWNLFKKSCGTNYAELESTAVKAPPPAYFFLEAAKHRGECFSMPINIRRIVKYDVPKPQAPGVNEIFEVWAWTDQAKSRPYVFLTHELPASTPIGLSINLKATFVGYFFKLQAYHSHVARPNDKPLSAPLFIGHIAPTVTALTIQQKSKTQNWIWLIAVAIVAPLIVIRVFFNSSLVRRKNVMPRPKAVRTNR